MEPPTDRKRMEVTVCNPFIPAGDYRRGLELTLQTIAPYLTQRELVNLVHKKLRLEDPGPAEAQYLQAAVELTVCAHYARYFTSSFVYEDKVMPPRDVDCSFCSGDYKFNVEVKCADYTAKHKVDSGSEFIIRAIGRQPDYRDTVAKLQKSFTSVGSTLVPGLHMDNKLKDYLYDAHGKFPGVADDRQYNVLVVGCDDPGDMQLWEGYLTGERGLFSGDSFADPARYSSVDLVVLTNLYHRHKSASEKDMLTGHWTFTNAFSILYANPRSRKPRAMLETFARTLRTYNNELSTHKIEGDAPEYAMQRLVISHYVSQVQWPSGQYCFQPKPSKSTQTEGC